MFFAQLARIAAIVAFLGGVLFIFNGYMIMTGERGPIDEAMAPYSATVPGQLIDKGALYVLVGVALGTLAEIGLWVRKVAEKL